MMKRSYYYLPFNPEAKIDYLNLLAFHDIAEYREEAKAYDTIHYSSINELADRLCISSSTVTRILNNDKYSYFMGVDKENKTIRLYCSFPKGQKAAFVRLTASEVEIIREQKKDQNLLAKYLIYMKYYCGFSKNKKTNFTATQFLTACGYSVKSNTNFDRLTAFNSLLSEKGIIKIEKWTDSAGHTRNTYAFI